MHGYTDAKGVAKYCKITEDIAGEYLVKASVNLNDWRKKLLPINLIMFLRKINPSIEDITDTELQKITLNNLFPEKFIEESQRLY